jgi:hypothetical protein
VRSKYCYRTKMKPCSSIHNLSYHGNCHPVCEVIGGIHCVCTVGLGGSHPMLGGGGGVDSSLPVLVHRENP